MAAQQRFGGSPDGNSRQCTAPWLVPTYRWRLPASAMQRRNSDLLSRCRVPVSNDGLGQRHKFGSRCAAVDGKD